MLSNLNCKCKDCSKRAVGCHVACTDYKEFKEALKKFNDKKREAKLSYHLLNCIEDHAIKKENYTARFFRAWRNDD